MLREFYDPDKDEVYEIDRDQWKADNYKLN